MINLGNFDIYWKRITYYWFIPFLFCLALITLINVTSIISFSYFFIIVVVFYYVIFNSLNQEIFFLYSTFSLLCILLYLLQYWLLPEFYGFSGGFGIGTDDSFYFSQVADSLPPGFPKRVNYLGDGINNYSIILKFITPYSINHPFDVLFFNCVGAAFTPIFTRETTKFIKNNKKVVWATFLFTAICPFLLSNSLVLVRDGWTATLLIGSIFFLFRKKWLLMIGAVMLLFYLRVASGGLALGTLVLFGLVIYSEASVNMYLKPLLFLGFLGVVGLVGIMSGPIIFEYMISKGIATGFFREAFFEEYFQQGETNPLFLKMMAQPAFIRIPLSTAFYAVMPLFSPDNITDGKVFIPRTFMNSIIYALLFIFYIHYLIRGFLYSLNNSDKKILLIFGLYIISLVLLSQMSLQPRHKTMIMPLMYILVGYGTTYFSYYGNRIAALLTAFFVIAQIVLIIV